MAATLPTANCMAATTAYCIDGFHHSQLYECGASHRQLRCVLCLRSLPASRIAATAAKRMSATTASPMSLWQPQSMLLDL